MSHGKHVFIRSKNGAMGYCAHCYCGSTSFGGKKIPELMRGLGKGVKEFKDATNKDEKDADK